MAGGVAGVHHHWQVGQPLEHRHHRQVQGVAGIGGLIGPNAPLAENDLFVAAGHDVLRAHQQLLNGARQAPLEKDGLVRFAQFLEHVKVLGVPGAHLDHIHLLKQGQVPDIHELCDNGQPRGLFGLQQQADALLSQPLEVIGRGPGLERAPPQEGGPGLFDLLGHIGDLLLRLHRAGAGDEGKMAPADGRGPRLNDRVLRVELPVDRLEGVGDPGHRLHNVQALDHLHIHLGGVADEPQNCLVLPLGDMDP